MTQRSRGFVLTWNNYSDIEYENFRAELEGVVEYYVIGEEVGEKGTPHLQGYIYLKNARTLSGVIKGFSKKIHWEIRKGTHLQAAEYCKKDKKFLEWGKAPVGEGKRSDISAVKEVIENGGGMKDVIEIATGYQALKTAEILLKYKEKKRDWKPKVMWFYGDTGCGKTKKANELMPNAWWSGKSLKWFEGYDAHEDVIIDDFRKDFCTFHELLRILDRYEYRIEVKGSSRQFLAKCIIITCPSHPIDLYDGRTTEDLNQLERRIDEIWRFSPSGLQHLTMTQPHSTEVGGNTIPPPINNACGADLENKNRKEVTDILTAMVKYGC